MTRATLRQVKSFDKAYYERFYDDPETQVTSAAETDQLVALVAAFASHLGLELESALDLGCGVGRWRSALEAHFPKLEYTGVELSEFLVAQYGWESGSVVDYDGASADLVVCQGVLQYLGKRDAARAIKNLAAHTEQLLFLEVLTEEDWAENCDRTVSDGDVHRRPAAWYRERLKKHFFPIGAGLFLPVDSPVVLYELERFF